MSGKEDITKKCNGILYEGGYDDFTVNCEGINKSSPDLEADKRLRYAYLLLNHPDTLEKIEQDNIILFHGTGSSALPSILKHGMKSVDKAKEERIELTTGEEWSRIGGKREFISFTDHLETAIRYANVGAITEQKGNAEFIYRSVTTFKKVSNII